MIIENIKISEANRNAWIKEKRKNKIIWFKTHPVIKESYDLNEEV
jgi:hypothetical protein